MKNRKDTSSITAGLRREANTAMQNARRLFLELHDVLVYGLFLCLRPTKAEAGDGDGWSRLEETPSDPPPNTRSSGKAPSGDQGILYGAIRTGFNSTVYPVLAGQDATTTALARLLSRTEVGFVGEGYNAVDDLLDQGNPEAFCFQLQDGRAS